MSLVCKGVVEREGKLGTSRQEDSTIDQPVGRRLERAALHMTAEMQRAQKLWPHFVSTCSLYGSKHMLHVVSMSILMLHCEVDDEPLAVDTVIASGPHAHRPDRHRR